MRSSLVRLGSLLPRLLARHGLSKKIKEQDVLVKWGEAVGHPVSSHTSALSIKQGQLQVKVDHPVWSHQLSLLKPAIIAKLNQAVGDAVVSDIRFTS